LFFASIVLELWKYFVIFFVLFSQGGMVGRRETVKLKIAARKKQPKTVIFSTLIYLKDPAESFNL